MAGTKRKLSAKRACPLLEEVGSREGREKPPALGAETAKQCGEGHSHPPERGPLPSNLTAAPRGAAGNKVFHVLFTLGLPTAHTVHLLPPVVIGNRTKAGAPEEQVADTKLTSPSASPSLQSNPWPSDCHGALSPFIPHPKNTHPGAGTRVQQVKPLPGYWHAI